MKAQFLVNCLKQTPQLDLPKAFWRWALKSEVGEAKIAEFANNLTLYTSINKETAGWRLFRIHRLNRRRRVDIKTKRLALVLFFLTKLFADRRLKDAFDQIKNHTAPGRIDVARRIIEMSKKRRQSAFDIWKGKVLRDKKAKEIHKNVLRRFLGSEWGRIAQAFQNMRLLPKRVDGEKPNRFQRGLEKVVAMTIRKTIDAFKKDY